jgi:hypothetical protein
MSIFKQTLAETIQTQLQARTNIITGEGGISPGRSELLPWYLSKNSWVRMTSMVNFTSGIIDAATGDGTVKVKPDGRWKEDELSKRYILEGGTLYTNKNNGVEIEAALRSNIGSAGGSYGGNFDVDGNGQQNKYTRQFGIRPMPGIESVNLHTIGAYGSIFETTIKFYAWDTKQLNDLEILFMRPGYSVLLEWGWSQYLDYSDEVQKSAKNLKRDQIYPSVFGGKTSAYAGKTINAFVPLTQQDIYDKLETLRVEYRHNYDGMLGYVKNFSWKMMRNGGYECSTTLISMGEVINSLKISTNNLKTKDYLDPDFDFDKKTNYLYDDYENILISLKSAGEGLKYSNNDPEKKLFIGEEEYKGNWNYEKDWIPRSDIIKKLIQNNHDVIANNLNLLPVVKKIKTGDNQNSSGQYFEYLPLDVIMAIMDSYFNIVVTSEKDTNTSTNPQKSVKIIPPRMDDYCLASKDSISVDPSICLVGNALAFKDEFGLSFNPAANEANPNPGVIIPVNKTIQSGIQLVRSDEVYTLNTFYEEDIKAARIANIYVNIDLLLNEYKSLKNAANDDGVNLMAYMKNILNKISNALGGLNTFVLSSAGRDQNTLRIIDTYYLEKKDDKYEFDLIGLGSICRSVDIESQIFPEQSTIIAIAAQSRANLGDIYNSTQVYLNAGITDRVALEKWQQEENGNNENKGTTENPFYQRLFDFLLYVKDNVVGTGDDFSISTDNSGTVPSTFLKQFMLRYNGELNFKALLPFKLTIKLDGIGGIVIGEIFKVKQNVLPENYYDKNLGFIITNISHALNKNDWETTLETQICLLDAVTLGENFIQVTRKGFKEFIGKYLQEAILYPIILNYMKYLALKAYITAILTSVEKNVNDPFNVAARVLNNKATSTEEKEIAKIISGRLDEINKPVDRAIIKQLFVKVSGKKVNLFSTNNFREFVEKWVEITIADAPGEILDTPFTPTKTYEQALLDLTISPKIDEIGSKIQSNINIFHPTDPNSIFKGVFDGTLDTDSNTLYDNITFALEKKEIISSNLRNLYNVGVLEDNSNLASLIPINNSAYKKIYTPFTITKSPGSAVGTSKYRTENDKVLIKQWFLALSPSYELTGSEKEINELVDKIFFYYN